MIRRILLVCTGNTCRSPMAEAMLREMARRRQVELEVRSAGVAALDGQPISAHAAEALRRRNVPLPTGGASSLKEDGAGWADLILTMTVRHKQALLSRFPDAAGKTYTLKEYAYLHTASGGFPAGTGEGEGSAAAAANPSDLDIADPFGGSLELYEQSADEIARALERVLDRLVASGEVAPAAGGEAGDGAAGEGAAGADAAGANAAGNGDAGEVGVGENNVGERSGG